MGCHLCSRNLKSSTAASRGLGQNVTVNTSPDFQFSFKFGRVIEHSFQLSPTYNLELDKMSQISYMFSQDEFLSLIKLPPLRGLLCTPGWAEVNHLSFCHVEQTWQQFYFYLSCHF